MANQWLRLWHDMPNDPKWRTIANKSGQPIQLVVAVFVHLLVDASRNVTRGHVTVTTEDLASALGVTDEEIDAVLAAMQGRVLEGDKLSAWGKRQPKREDSGDPETGAKSAAQRQREKRERDRMAAEEGQDEECHASSRNVTTDKDKDKEKSKPSPAAPDGFAEFWQAYPKKRSKGDAEKAWKKLKPSNDLLKTILRAVEVAKRGDDWRKDGGQYIPHPATWLNAKGWEDEQGAQSSSEVVSLFRGCL